MSVYTLLFLVATLLAVLGIFIPNRHLVAISAALTAATLLVEGTIK